MSKRSIPFILFALLALLPASAVARTTLRADSSFGSEGIVEGQFGPHYEGTTFTSVAPQPDGSLLAARRSLSESLSWLRRYSADGTLDTEFTPKSVSNQAEAVDGEGKVLKTNGSLVERFNPDGSRDSTFQSQLVDFRIEAIEPLPSGKILIGGSIVIYVPETEQSVGETYVEQVALARLDHEGNLDPSFGGDGVVKLKNVTGVSGERLLGLFERPGERVGVVVLDKVLGMSGESVVHSSSTVFGLTAGGVRDASFGNSGAIRLPDTAILFFHVLPDGKLLVAGDRWGAQLSPSVVYASDLFFARYTANGELDPSFGADGSVVLDLGGIDLTQSALWEEDGSVALGGSITDLASLKCWRYSRFCPETPFVVRFTADGAVDPGFGADGVARFASLSYPYGMFIGGIGVQALAARPGGGIFAAGGSGTVAFIAALSPSGALDPGFGSGGIVTEAKRTSGSSAGHAMAIDARGRILVAGRTSSDMAEGWPEGALFRFLPDGELDRSFGGGSGYVRMPGDPSKVAVASDGSYFVLFGGSYPWTLTRITAAGRVDASYGEEGMVQMPGPFDVYRKGKRHRLSLNPTSMAPLPGGGLLLAGTAGYHSEPRVFALRLRADGSLDPSFGKQGVAIFGFGRSRRCVATQMAVDRHGDIVLVGYVMGSPEGHSEEPATMRLRSGGTRDRSFGHGGLVVTRVGRHGFAGALAVQRNGAILVGGRSYAGGRVSDVLLRYRSDGRLDRGFARDGLARLAVPIVRGGIGTGPKQIVLLHGRIVVLRDHPHRQLVVFSSDGKRHHSFVVGRGTGSEKRGVQAPFGAIQNRRLLIGWQSGDLPASFFELERLLVEGRP